MDKRILQAWLKAGYIENDAFYATEEGTPQGGIVTPRTQKRTSSLSV